MKPATRIVVALVAGLALGALGEAAAPDAFAGVVKVAQPIGQIWLDALKMTLVPLVFALLVTGVASAAQAAAAGGLTARTLATILGILCVSATLALTVTPLLFAAAPLDATAAQALRGAVTASSVPSPPPLAEWLTGIIPANIVKAASDGAMLSIVIFALLFGFAVARIETARRDALLRVVEGLADTMQVIVGWVLWAAPLGVFALALVVTATTGIAAVAGLAHYLVVVCIICALMALLAYPLAMIGGRVPLAAFARAALPAQAVAISTQSSLASLPAMIDGVRRLGVAPQVAGVVLPMGVALMRATSPAANLVISLFIAQLYGIDLALPQIIAGGMVAVLVSLATVSVPSQASFFTGAAPIALAMGLPLDLLALLIAVETIPDIFRTLGNATHDMALTTVVARRSGTLAFEQKPAG